MLFFDKSEKKPMTCEDIKTHNIGIYMKDIIRHCMQQFIQNTYWRYYITLGPTSRIQNGITLIYVEPSQNFWNLRETNMETFKDLGIYVRKNR